MSTRTEMRQKYLALFPAKKVDRFTISCPDCKIGQNSKDAGGNDKCFHCGNCGLVECEVTSPVLDM